MTLREWLESIGKSGVWLASELGVTHQAVYAWLNGKADPRLMVLKQIEHLSGGQVTAKSFRSEAEVSDAP
jgi:transcriptional regulator with XRE-family HTH domain